MMETKIVPLVTEYGAVFLAIVVVIPLLYGLWRLFYHALPGDREIFSAIQQARALKNQALDQSQQVIKEVSELRT